MKSYIKKLLLEGLLGEDIPGEAPLDNNDGGSRVKMFNNMLNKISKKLKGVIKDNNLILLSYNKGIYDNVWFVEVEVVTRSKINRLKFVIQPMYLRGKDIYVLNYGYDKKGPFLRFGPFMTYDDLLNSISVETIELMIRNLHKNKDKWIN